VHEPLLQTNAISEDAKRRVEEFKQNCPSPIGAYTQNSRGWDHVRNAVAKFIEERDGIPAYPENIHLTNGASEGVRTAFQTLIRNPHDGILVPIPQYPLYSALLTLKNGTLLTYYLKEDEGWTLDAEALEKKIYYSKERGFTPRAIVVINPGNPTGQVMHRRNLEQIIKLCH
jgi:aspartate/methionine/tyrosine aminotransferase